MGLPMVRPRGPAAHLALPLAFVLLAGCSAGTSGTLQAAQPSVEEFAPDAEVDVNHGAILGFVLDSELNPVPLTQLLLRPTDQTTVSAADGSYVFSMLDPGIYSIYASRLGFTAKEVRAEVRAEEATQADI